MTKVVITTWATFGKAYAKVDGVAYPECPKAICNEMTPVVGDVKCIYGSWCALSNNENRCPYGCD
jgi:hypothetical protein